MKTLFEKTKMTPKVTSSKENGKISLEGNLITLENPTFWKEISKRLIEDSQTKEVQFDLEYVNTESLRNLLNLIKKTNGIKYKWYYQDFDDDMLEMGKNLELISKAEFEFIEKKS